MNTILPTLNKLKSGMVDMASKAWEWVKALVKGKAVTTATETLSSGSQIGGGIGSKVKDVLTKSTTTPAVTDISKQTQTVQKGSNFNAGSMLKGAAAILVLSGALWVAAKAFQEFANVTWENVGMGLTAILGLAGVAMLLGKATSHMILGAAAIAILGASLIPFAYALSLLTPVIDSLGGAITNIITSIVPVLQTVGNLVVNVINSIAGGIATIIGSISMLVTSILPLLNTEAAVGMIAFAGSILALSQALAAFSVVGLMATPAMIAVGTFANTTSGIFEGGGGESNNDTMDALLAEIKGLRQDMASGKIAVNVDGYKLTSRISKIVESSPIT
jgi:hypothetical protein